MSHFNLRQMNLESYMTHFKFRCNWYFLYTKSLSIVCYSETIELETTELYFILSHLSIVCYIETIELETTELYFILSHIKWYFNWFKLYVPNLILNFSQIIGFTIERISLVHSVKLWGAYLQLKFRDNKNIFFNIIKYSI